MKNEAVMDIQLSKNKQLLGAYDRIVVKMHLQRQQYNHSIFLVCGTDPRVGASSVALHLAAGLAKSGQKILLLDADMRKEMSKKGFGDTYKATLADYLTKDITMDKIIYGTTIKKLSIIPGGVAADPVQLLCSGKMKILLEILRGYYDFVLIDVPSVGATADANAILGYVDQVVLVAAPERSYKKQILECYETFQKYGVNLLGVVVNRVDKYGYHDYVKNASYYMDNENKNIWIRILQKIKEKGKAIKETKRKK